MSTTIVSIPKRTSIASTISPPALPAFSSGPINTSV